MKFFNYFFNKKAKKSNQKGFSLVELIITIAIMAILAGIAIPLFNSYLHKARVATDWENLENYYKDIQLDFSLTGQYNDKVPTDLTKEENWKQTEIHFLDGQTVQMKAGYFAVSKAKSGKGYQISYYCNECLSNWDKHKDTCILTLGA